jgi:hypothetical protein
MLKRRRKSALVAVMLSLSVLACSIRLPTGQPSKPVVEIVSPLNGSEVGLGEELVVLISAEDEVGISRVELEANGQMVAVKRSDRAEGEPTLRATLPWTPTVPGSQTLLVYAYNVEGVVSDGVGVRVVVVASAPTSTTFQSTPGDATPGAAVASPTVGAATLAPATATIVASPTAPAEPTATTASVLCPSLRITLPPSQTRPKQTFGIQFDRTGAMPAGYDYIVEFSGDNATWNRTQPIPARVREDGAHWMAETSGPGVEGTFYWRICLVKTTDPGGPALCCTQPPAKIVHTR